MAVEGSQVCKNGRTRGGCRQGAGMDQFCFTSATGSDLIRCMGSSAGHYLPPLQSLYMLCSLSSQDPIFWPPGKVFAAKMWWNQWLFGFVSDTVFDHIVRKILGHPGYLEALTLVSRNWEIYWTEHPGFVGSCFDAQLGPYSPKPKQKESIPLCFYFCCTEKLSFSWGIQLSTFRKELHLKLASE